MLNIIFNDGLDNSKANNILSPRCEKIFPSDNHKKQRKEAYTERAKHDLGGWLQAM